MATNIEIDEQLFRQAQRVTQLKTKRAVVEEGLRTLIWLYEQREVRDLRGRLHWEDGRSQKRGK
ncbi:MAG TPA: type II toxin-antitoxin system VapB family antitoxin [Thermoanaerobaculia bacterium]|nr:type II toxin-antitoxin system VapB family antitoxin [Thermoanaerobaculia bacterium]